MVRSKWIATPHLRWLNLTSAIRSGSEKLDLYLPVPRGAHSRPNMVSQTFANFFLSSGYAMASVNYRLSTPAAAAARADSQPGRGPDRRAR